MTVQSIPRAAYRMVARVLLAAAVWTLPAVRRHGPHISEWSNAEIDARLGKD